MYLYYEYILSDTVRDATRHQDAEKLTKSSI